MYLHLINFRIFFCPAKFDKFKDETMSEYKTVSVSQSQILVGLKTLCLLGLLATFEGSFFYVLGGKKCFLNFSKNILANALKSYIKCFFLFFIFLKKFEKVEKTGFF